MHRSRYGPDGRIEAALQFIESRYQHGSARPVKARKRCRGEAAAATGISGAYWRGSRPGPMTVLAASRPACHSSSGHSSVTPVAAAMSHVWRARRRG